MDLARGEFVPVQLAVTGACVLVECEVQPESIPGAIQPYGPESSQPNGHVGESDIFAEGRGHTLVQPNSCLFWSLHVFG